MSRDIKELKMKILNPFNDIPVSTKEYLCQFVGIFEQLQSELKQAKKHANDLGDLLAKTEKELEDLKNEQSKK